MLEERVIAMATDKRVLDILGSSGEYLEVYGLLKLTCIPDEFNDLFLALVVSVHFSNVLVEDAGTLAAEDAPQILDKGLVEEYQPLLATVLKVDVEVVLLDGLAVRSKLVLNLLYQSALLRDLR